MRPTKQQNVNQGMLIDKLIRFMEIDSKTTFDDTKKSILRGGLCYGFSVVHSYMAATEKLEWWKDLLQNLADWDGTEESLKNPLALKDASPDSTDKRSVILRSEINRVVNYVLYNYAGTSKSKIDMDDQQAFLKPHPNPHSLEKTPRFFSSEGEIKHYAVVAGFLSKQTLSDLFNPQFFNQRAIYLISNDSHACTLRCRMLEGKEKWYFYDPNYREGEQEFENKESLISEIDVRLGSCLSITIASWQEIDTKLFNTFYDEMTPEQAITLLHFDGLSLIAREAPAQLPELFKLANKDEAVKSALVRALTYQTNDGRTGLHFIARYAPDQLPMLLELANKDEVVKNALARALTLQTKNDKAGLYFIAKYAPDKLPALFHHITRYSSDKLPALFKLAEENKRIKNALATALMYQTNDDWTGLQLIAEYAPAQLPAFLSIVGAKEAEYLKKAFIELAKKTHPNPTQTTSTETEPASKVAAEKTITVEQLRSCLDLYGKISAKTSFFSITGPELDAIRKLTLNQKPNNLIQYTDIEQAIKNASGLASKSHRVLILANPASNPEDNSRVSLVIRAIGAIFQHTKQNDSAATPSK